MPLPREPPVPGGALGSPNKAVKQEGDCSQGENSPESVHLWEPAGEVSLAPLTSPSEEGFSSWPSHRPAATQPG